MADLLFVRAYHFLKPVEQLPPGVPKLANIILSIVDPDLAQPRLSMRPVITRPQWDGGPGGCNHKQSFKQHSSA